MTATSVHQEQAKAPQAALPDGVTRRTCSYCGEPWGSISKGTGRPLVVDRSSATGEAHHVNCKPAVSVAALDRMVGA